MNNLATLAVPPTAAPLASPELSLLGQRWALREADERTGLAIAQQLGVPEILGRVLAGRGVTPDEAAAFLNPTLKHYLPDPSHFFDMDKAASRLADAVMAGETIAVFGDYDVDGATSSALLARFFRSVGSEILIHIPDRIAEGYGPNAPALLALRARGASVVVTVDCGTLSFEPIASAKAAGLEVIVIDHHQAEARLPEALAVVNPNRMDESSPHRHLAACGLAFLLAVAVNRSLRDRGWFSTRPVPDLIALLDLVALGTVCDVVSLTGVNRALVAQGLKVLGSRGNIGLRALCDVARLTEKPACYHAGYILGPRINAGGRVGKAPLGARLLSTDDEAEAAAIARELDRYNAERKAIESIALEEAFAMAEEYSGDGVLVLAREGWHPGVIGIVAGRIKEKYHVPTAVIALDNGIGKASARSVSGVDFGAAVAAARLEGLLIAGGGHAMAAGFTVAEENIPALRRFFAERIGAASARYREARSLMLDGYLSPAGVTPELAELLEKAGPYGSGHPCPRFALRDVIVAHASPVGSGEHIRLVLQDGQRSGESAGRADAIAFRAAGTPLEAALKTGARLHVAGQIRLNSWNGRVKADLQVEDVMAVNT